MSYRKSLITIVLPLVLVLALIIVFKPGWKCTEKGCERSMTDTRFSSKNDCEKSCKNKLSSSTTTTNTKNKWCCNSSVVCAPSDTGYDTHEECLSKCKLKFYPTFNPVMSDYGMFWSNRYNRGRDEEGWHHDKVKGGWTFVGNCGK